RELVGVGRAGDLAHRLGRLLVLALARADDAAQVHRRRVEPALLRDLLERAFRLGELAEVVPGAAAQVRALAGGGRGNGIRLLDRVEPREDARVIARLDRDVDRAAVSGAPVRLVGAALQHALDDLHRGPVAARALERDREVV